MPTRLRVLGAVLDGPAPLGLIEVPLEPGCLALFGLNGVGKSRILAAVADLCAGRPHGEGYLHARVELDADDPQDLEPPVELLVDEIERELETLRRWAIPQMSDVDLGPTGEPVADALLELLWFRSADTLRSTGAIDIDYLREIAEQRRITLRPAGDGSWELEVGIIIPECPRACQDLDRLNSFDDQGIVAEAEAMGNDWPPVGGPVPFDSPLTSRWILGDSFRSREAFRHDLRALTQSPFIVRPVLEADRLDYQRPLTVRFPDLPLFETLGDVQLEPAQLDITTRDALLPYGIRPGPRGTFVATQTAPAIDVAGEAALPADDMQARVSSLTALAKELHRHLGPEAPQMRCHLRPPAEWFDHPAVEWQCEDESGIWVSLAALSPARRRWACLVGWISLLASGDDHQDHDHFLITLDEPESGLHVRAERAAVTALSKIAEATGAIIVTATHSRWFLNDRDTRLLHAFRDADGRTAVRALTERGEQALDDLGLERSDAFALTSAFLIVEGRHDEVIFKSLFASDLAEVGARIIPIRGAKNLPAIANARLITDLTDVPIVIVLDNLRTDEINTYLAALAAAPRDDVRQVDALTSSMLPKTAKSNEEGFVTEIARGLHERGDLRRLTVHGLVRPDVIRYLPAASLVPGYEDWDTLDAEHEAAKGTKNWIKDFKAWARDRRKADFSDEALRLACAQLDDLPPDLASLPAAVAAAIAANPPSLDAS